ADRAGERVVGDRCDQDAQHDRPGLAELCGEDEGQQLRLVADFCQRDDASGNEKGFQSRAPWPERIPMTMRTPASPAASWSKVLPGRETARAMAGGPSVLTRAPSNTAKGGYSPMTGRILPELPLGVRPGRSG